VDDDNFLILNHGRIYGTTIQAMQPVESFSICFRPQLVEQTYAAMSASIGQALAKGDTLGERTPEFNENLQPHDRLVTPVLRFIKWHLREGLEDEAWYEEQLIFLLARMRAHHEQVLRYVDGMRLIRASTRREVYRRIRIATDYLHTNYPQVLDLDEVAKVAYMSKYHFLRLFTLVHGITPFAFLQRKRAHVALRLLQTTELPVSEVASTVGFAQRSTVARQIRRWTGLAPSEITARRLQCAGADPGRTARARVPPSLELGRRSPY
jgi:AraC-like DNA-binding protein